MFLFTLRPGEVVALVGASGSGKTTVLNVIQGFLKPQQGSVSVKQIPAAIQQKPYIFAGSILDNLRFGNEELSEAEILQVCQQTGLAQLLQRLPAGVHTPVGQGGVGLSGGQRQMIAMVRAICQQKEFVLFDEATANLDLATERQLNQSLRQLLKRPHCIDGGTSFLYNSNGRPGAGAGGWKAGRAGYTGAALRRQGAYCRLLEMEVEA